MTVKKPDIYATIGTIAVCTMVLLILLYCGISASHDQTAEGIEVTFGYDNDGFGATDEIMIDEEQPTTPASAARPVEPTPAPNIDEALMIQKDESVAIAQEKKRKQEQEKARLLAEQRERERKAAEEQAERERKEAEKAKRDAENREKAEKANKLTAGVFGQQTGSGSGTTSGSSMQGNPVGAGTDNRGTSWSLKGRSLRGSLPRPDNESNSVGIIVVNIRVDRNGNVTEAIVNANATTITDAKLRNASVAAAKQVRFSAGDNIAFGTITYNFSITDTTR